jgi:hypothetical protein
MAKITRDAGTRPVFNAAKLRYKGIQRGGWVDDGQKGAKSD